MARDFAKKFYDSSQWKNCRNAYIAKRISIDGGMCETCHRELGVIVHHTIWLSPENITNPDIALNADLLKYDCLICHNKESENEQDRERCSFGENGEVLPPR